MARRVLLVLLLGLIPALIPPTAGAAKPPSTPSRIVELDPGHGGGETGAVNTINGTTLYEKDINLAVALAAQSKLQALGFTLYLTRTTDVDMSLSNRVEKANSDGAGVMLSIHHNGSSDPTVNYTTSYYTQKSDQRIANLAQTNLVSLLGFPSHGIQRNGFTLTVKPKMASALTEAWFVTDDAVAADYMANRSSYLDRKSQALANAVVQFYQ